MCLSSSITKDKLSFTARNNLNDAVGYKAVYVYNDKIYPQIYNECFGFELPKNRWIHDTQRIHIEYSDGGYYQSGFHICLTLSAAKEYLSRKKIDWRGTANAIFKVKYKDIVQLGVTHHPRFKYPYAPIVVARSMILKERILLVNERGGRVCV